MNFDAHRPIYLQIVDYLHEQILTGAMGENEKIPSVRELATQMSVTPNTATRACAILQQQGVVTARRGVGLFVHGESKHMIQAIRRAEFIEHELPKTFRTMQVLDIEVNELLALHAQFLAENK